MNPQSIDQIHELLLRLVLATVLGAIMGIDRDLHRKPAGIRVLAMVSMGAAAISMLSVVAVVGTDARIGDDVFKTIQGVLSGIGFLGAGVIMRAQGKDEVHGITTAASIWVAAILGMICGLGQFMLATCTFGIAAMILVGGRRLESAVLRFAPPPASGSSQITSTGPQTHKD